METSVNIVISTLDLFEMQVQMIKSVAPPPRVCTNMYNRKLQCSASIKKVTKLHIHHLDNFFCFFKCLIEFSV